MIWVSLPLALALGICKARLQRWSRTPVWLSHDDQVGEGEPNSPLYAVPVNRPPQAKTGPVTTG